MGDHRINPRAFGTKAVEPTKLRDGFNRELALGDLIALTKPLGLPLFRVISIAPNLDPSAPPNTLKVFLRADVPMLVRANQPTQELVRVFSAEEAGITVEEHAPQQSDEPQGASETLPVADAPPIVSS